MTDAASATEATVLTVTYDNDAWEWFYDYLGNLSNKLAVRLTTSDGTTHTGEFSVDGEVYTSENNPTVTIRPVDGDGPQVTVPLFAADGQCNIVAVHVL